MAGIPISEEVAMRYGVYERGCTPEAVWEFDSMEGAWHGLCWLYEWGLRGCIRDGLGNEWTISQCPDDVYAQHDAAIS